MPLVAKMAKDIPSLMDARVNFELICNVNLLISLSCLLHMLETIHALIKFSQKKNVFVCDYVQSLKFAKDNITLIIQIMTQSIY
jgi:hypothetical protein